MTHEAWVERDAAVVWHGFTQMAAYADNHPIIVDRAEGHELIDVDGNRYLDAISSLWVTTLGHRVPELDDAIRAPARPRRALDDARQRQPRGHRAVGGARARRAGRRAALPVRVRRRGRGRAGAEDRVPVLGQPRPRRARPSSRSAARTTATRSARCRSATAGSAPTSSIRCASPCCARPRSATADCFDVARRDWSATHARELAAVIVEPLVQGAAGHAARRPATARATRRRVPRARRAADLRRGRNRVRPHRHAVRVRAVRPPPRPAVPRQGHHRRLPRDVGDRRERTRVRRVPRRRPRRADASTTATPTAGTRSPPRSRCATSSSSRRGTCSTNVRERSDELRALLARPRRVASRP